MQRGLSQRIRLIERIFSTVEIRQTRAGRDSRQIVLARRNREIMSHVNAGLQAGTLRHARWSESERTRRVTALHIWKIVRSRRDHHAKMNIAT